MDVAQHVSHLKADGLLLADAAVRAGWEAKVPGLDWNVRELVTHVGGVHRWAADVITAQATDFDTLTGDAVGTGPGDHELLAWFRAGHAQLISSLRSAPANLQCATLFPAISPLAFWARRQAHETAVHRSDAEAASGRVNPFNCSFAQDGIDELLRGFAARRGSATPHPVVLCLHALDGPSWRVTVDNDRICAEHTDEMNSDLLVTGSSSELYLWLWNRPSTAIVAGQTALAEAWTGSVRVQWS